MLMLGWCFAESIQAEIVPEIDGYVVRIRRKWRGKCTGENCKFI
jgi:hypothetical protein